MKTSIVGLPCVGSDWETDVPHAVAISAINMVMINVRNTLFFSYRMVSSIKMVYIYTEPKNAVRQ